MFWEPVEIWTAFRYHEMVGKGIPMASHVSFTIELYSPKISCLKVLVKIGDSKKKYIIFFFLLLIRHTELL